MTERTDDKRLSKFLSLVLRHRPGQFGIELDSEGFTDADDLWGVVVRRYGDAYSRADFERVLTSPARDGKSRYELTEDGRARARYGHNRAVTAIQYELVTPPAVLYHGTPASVVDAIRRDGLTPQARQYVHMATTTERATSVGARHGKPVLLVVRAREAHAAGVGFYQADEEHYLAEAVPAAYITFPGE